MHTHTLESLEAFIEACRQRDAHRVVLAWRAEWGPAGDGSRDGEYHQRRECRVLAYDRGTIVACDLVDHDRAAIHEQLVAAGLSVELRSRNLATYDD